MPRNEATCEVDMRRNPTKSMVEVANLYFSAFDVRLCFIRVLATLLRQSLWVWISAV